MASLDLQTEVKLPILNIKEGTSFELVFEFFEEDETTPFNVPGIWQMVIGRAGKEALKFTMSDGITVSNNEVRVKCLAAKNTLIAGTHQYDISHKQAGDLNTAVFTGDLTVNSNFSK